jgi:WD40 repeat protein
MTPTNKPQSKILLLITLVILLFTHPLAGAEKPILQLDTGGHKALIRDVIFTKDGRYLVSASDDKTIRVWDVRTGQINRIIRGQIGEGDEGKIFAAALSPDNEWLAVGGWMGPTTNYDLKDLGRIRLYHFPTGQLTALLKGHTSVVNSLAFSSDSRYLASGSGDFTVRIWKIATQKMLHTLNGHSDVVYALAYLPDNRKLVSGAYDNTLILWDTKTGKRENTMKGHTNKIQSVAVSPDGRYIISGSWDKTIRLWDAQGNFIREFAKQGTEVASLSFSNDGKKVLTGTNGWNTRTCNIFQFPSGTKLHAFTKHKNSVFATAISPNNQLAATGGGNDQEIFLWDIQTGNVRHKLVGKGTRVLSVGFGKDNASVAWGNEWQQSSPTNRGPLQKWLKIPTPSQNTRVEYKGMLDQTDQYVRATDHAGQFQLRATKGGNYGYNAILEIVKYEQVIASIERDATSGYGHKCYTFTPDQQTIVSGGGNGFLTLYKTHSGQKVHDFIGHTGDVWSVAVSPDGKRLVSGSADQTVKIWDLHTGRNLITLFVGSDDQWVAWTPSGYYTASLYGEQYIGWLINKGPDRVPDYYAASQFSEMLHRPNIVASTLYYGDEALALNDMPHRFEIKNMADIAPPEIRILMPEDGFETTQERINLEISIDKASAEINDIAIYVNNRQMLSPQNRRLNNPFGGVRKSYTIRLEPGKNKVKAEVRNSRHATAASVISVIRKAALSQAIKGDLYIMSIGVNELKHIPYNNLKFPAKDAVDIVNVMKTMKGKLFKSVHATIFSDYSDQKPISTDIEDELYTLRNATKNDTVMLFLAGHGVRLNDREYIFLTRNAKMRPNNSYRMSTVLKWSKVIDAFRKINARRIVFLDTCYSGNVNATEMAKMGSDSEIVIFSSSTGYETSQELDKLQNGIFTHAICKGLTHGIPADMTKDNEVDINELAAYVKTEVKRHNPEQTPNLAAPNGVSFPFFLR